MQDVNINKVSCLDLHLFNSPVSFLVDNGAGVSLIPGDIWDKVGNTDCKLQTTHRLLGLQLKWMELPL